jgi:hypothetical protein
MMRHVNNNNKSVAPFVEQFQDIPHSSGSITATLAIAPI